MSIEHNRKLIEDYWKAFEDVDVDAAMHAFSDDAVYENTSLGQSAHGKDNIRTMWSEWFGGTAAGSFTTTLDSVVIGEDGFALEWTVTAKLDGTIGATTGSSAGDFEVRGSSVGTIRDGLITGNRDYSNMATAVAAAAGG